MGGLGSVRTCTCVQHTLTLPRCSFVPQQSRSYWRRCRGAEQELDAALLMFRLCVATGLAANFIVQLQDSWPRRVEVCEQMDFALYSLLGIRVYSLVSHECFVPPAAAAWEFAVRSSVTIPFVHMAK